MKKLKRNIKLFSITAIFCVGFVIVVLVLFFGISIAKAAWEEPSAQPPGGNIYVPLNIGPDNQAKKGSLLLDPLYNPYGDLPSIGYPLEVRGENDVFINYLTVDGGLNVDTGTLYLDNNSDSIGIGTLTPATKLDVVGGSMIVRATSGGAIIAQTDGWAQDDKYGLYGLSQGDDFASIYGYSDDGIGVYGVSSVGAGIYARSYSNDNSAVVGSTSAGFSAGFPYVAGIYASARGLDDWAGYFAQSLYGSEDVVGRKFVPNRLQYSQVPYTAGREVRQIDSSTGITPKDIIFDGTYIWTANNSTDTVSRFRAADGVKLGDYAVGTEPRQITFDGTSIWVSNSTGNLTELNAQDGTVIGTVVTGKAASGNDLLFDGAYLWLSFGASNDIVKVDPASGPVGTYAVGANPTGLAFDGEYVWVINNADNSIARVRVSDGVEFNCNGTGPGSTRCSAGGDDLQSIIYDGTYLWVGAGTEDIAGNNVFKLRATDGELVGKYSISTEAVAVRNMTFDGINVWVAYNDASDESYLGRIVMATNEVIEGVNYGSCTGSSGMAFDSSHIWVSDEICIDTLTLRQFYSGSGYGLTDLNGVANLQPDSLLTAQAGSFSLNGTANFGTNLTVLNGDLVVQNNVWGGADSMKDFGTGCDDGEFAKGIDTTGDGGKLQCRPL